ncbi:MAG: adenosine-specific kinase [Desulfobacterota bacterium]|nr:adenosine-specific kinase [Thermodesulfobacteriota bacterium]MDW8001930.1 adenosine-specific kinase [Deltaproteobacteria bacterium]
MEIKAIPVEIPEGANIIIGQAHFMKTVEDLYEILASSSPSLRFGIAFSEASGPCLVRCEGNDDELIKKAAETSLLISCGHSFVIYLKDGYPINVLNAIKACQEVCHIICATANPLKIIVAEDEQGRGIIGVIDGFKPKGVEKEEDRKARKEFLRKIKYKL